MMPGIASAEVEIPADEYAGYVDANGVYTVIGNIKNGLDHAIVPVISVSVGDGATIHTRTIQHVPLAASAEVPFKMKFPEVAGGMPTLMPAQVHFERTYKEPVPILVLYDDTLITHDDGHVTGRIQNAGGETIHNPKIFAVVHGHDGILDVVQNIRQIGEIAPGEIVDFAMYHDPAITDDVLYYSCFAPVDTTVIPVTAKKNGSDFDFRYDSGAWYSNAQFDETGTIMSIRGYNSYPLDTYANFEFPPITGEEEFFVTFNGEPIEFTQSIDELGFWHVAYDVGPRSQGIIQISGFAEGLPPEMPRVPPWIKQGAGWWVDDQISDMEFLQSLDLLTTKGVIGSPSVYPVPESRWHIPEWVKQPVAWWNDGDISDDEFLNMIEHLILQGIVVV